MEEQKKETITHEQHIIALYYKAFSETPEYENIIKNLGDEILRARNTGCRIEDSEKMFMHNWMINGFDNCRLYIQKQVQRAEKVEKGDIIVKESK